MSNDAEADETSLHYQRLTWDALRKNINGLVNKVNATNIKDIIPELFAENLIRGRDVFKQVPQFVKEEKRYKEVKKSILGDEFGDVADSDAGSEDEDDEESDEEDDERKINDETETNLVNLRRTIYVAIMSSVDFEEAGHKLLESKLELNQVMELCIMLLECCSQERTYLRYYGLLGQRFWMINKIHQDNFEKCFVKQYSNIHRLETNELRNVAKFFSHLLGTDALPLHVLAYIRLTEEDTLPHLPVFSLRSSFRNCQSTLGFACLMNVFMIPQCV
ncbi:hypothetical protein RHMOL_Rhmol01G0265000 [Rhododendron molle]|uniref:Uncharacterized protein n=1 Tax=Rhododendron molle TaxID=49168 RepID=A0ACC0Q605_RHOML|nr:hypothetical protein RHMOL_Rhmol01G0265000 [Rhododendron molle]